MTRVVMIGRRMNGSTIFMEMFSWLPAGLSFFEFAL